MKVYITEKASQVSSLNAALKTIMKRNEYKIVSLSGHIMRLKNPNEHSNGLTKNWVSDYENGKLPFVPSNWDKIVVKDKAQLYKNVQNAVKTCKEIILAPDPDNEGVTLAMEVVKDLGVEHKVSGMINMSKLDLPSLKKEILITQKIPWRRMFKAGEARSYLDWIYGMNGTVAASVILGNYFKRKGRSNTLHIGGVKLPTLRMVVERDIQFETFKNIPFWKIEGIAEKDGQEFKVTFEYEGNDKFDREEAAKQIVEDMKNGKMTGVVDKFEEKDKKSGPPKPMALSDLQAKSSSKYKFSLDKTLSLAQSLYDKKYQSYPRTDNNYYSEGQYEEVPDTLKMIEQIDDKYKNIVANLPQPYLKREIFNDKKVTAHTALSPTTIFAKDVDVNEDKVYKIVVNRYLIQFMPDYEYLAIKGEAKTPIDNFKVKFGENIMKDMGWKELETPDKKDGDEGDSSIRTIPTMKKSDDIIIKKINIKKGETKPKARFTDGTLVGAMKNIGNFYDFTDPKMKKLLKDAEGIGQEATRSNIIKDLFAGGYFEYEGKAKKIKSTEKGRELIKLLPEEMSNPVLRATMEFDLKEIIRGNKEPQDVVDKITKFVKESIEKLEIVAKNNNIEIQKASVRKTTTGFGCPKCKKGNLETNGKYYKCTEGKWNPKTKKMSGCTFVLFSTNKAFDDEKMTEDNLKDLLEGKTLTTKTETKITLDTSEKYGLKVEWGKKGGGFPRQQADENGIIDFKKGFKKDIDGVEVVVWNPLFGRKMKLEEATQILNGERIKFKGFKKKRGGTFDSFIIIKDGKVSLDFSK